MCSSEPINHLFCYNDGNVAIAYIESSVNAWPCAQLLNKVHFRTCLEKNVGY